MSKCLLPPLLLVPALLSASSAAIASKPAAYYVAEAEVSIGSKDVHRDAIREELRSATIEEAHYYDPAQRPVTMRIAIDKLGFKSTGKALTSSLPVVGMFAPANENVMRGRVELVDRETGKTVASFKIKCDDYTSFSAADGMLTYADVATSFLPFGGLVSAAIDAGRSAAGNREKAERKLVRGFVMLSYKAAYGAPLYKSFGQRRKADLALKDANPAVVLAVPDAAAASVSDNPAHANVAVATAH